jgi:hypothetical protein
MKDDSLIIAVLIGLVVFFAQPSAPSPGPSPDGPSAKMREHVEPVRAKLSSADWAAKRLVSSGLRDLSTVLDRNPGVITNTNELVRVIRDTLAILSKSAELRGKIPGLSEAVEKSFASAFGADTAPVEQSVAVDYIRALSWACGE